MKKLILRIVFFILARAIKGASRFDSEIQKIIEPWPDDFLILFKVEPRGPSLALQKQRGRLVPFDTSLPEAKYDLIIYFKTLKSAFRIFTAQQGVPWAFAENRMNVKGNIPYSLGLIRCLDRVQSYLFPKIVCSRIMKKVPSQSFFKRLALRFYLYTVSIPLGI